MKIKYYESIRDGFKIGESEYDWLFGGRGSILNFRSDFGFYFCRGGIFKDEVLKTNTDWWGRDPKKSQ